jgi:hypothetical protein
MDFNVRVNLAALLHANQGGRTVPATTAAGEFPYAFLRNFNLKMQHGPPFENPAEIRVVGNTAGSACGKSGLTR